jgi:ceramide glucosyltransferase
MTLLKPLKGLDAETEACLASWLDQDYPGRLQFLFGVASAEDPVCPLVQRLLAARPHLEARLVTCPERLGPNAKLSTLAQLQPLATHGLLVVSDADVRVPPDLLGQLAAALAPSEVGLVNCPYRLANPEGMALRWEAVAVNADFWSQVLQSRALAPQDFALGAVMGVKRQALEHIGGFAALVHHLADDFELGHRIVRSGRSIAMCPVVVDCREPIRGWAQVWSHQIRWARTIRVCRPGPYFASILSNGSIWPLGLLLAAAWAGPGAEGATLLGGTALGLRLLAAGALQNRFAPETQPWRHLGMVLVKDVLAAVVWFLAFAGNRVEWRGQRFYVQRDGRLISAPPMSG